MTITVDLLISLAELAGIIFLVVKGYTGLVKRFIKFETTINDISKEHAWFRSDINDLKKRHDLTKRKSDNAAFRESNLASAAPHFRQRSNRRGSSPAT